MRAYKVLSDGRSMFTGWRWPLPGDDEPGEWVQATGPLGLCTNGVHASSTEQLPQWLGEEIWEIELGGEILREAPALIASRARLIRRIDAWDVEMRRRFAQACLERARELAADYPFGEGLVAKVEHTIWWGGAAPAGYFTAMLAGQRATGGNGGADYDAVFVRERALQADWLRRELGLAD